MCIPCAVAEVITRLEFGSHNLGLLGDGALGSAGLDIAALDSAGPGAPAAMAREKSHAEGGRGFTEARGGATGSRCGEWQW